MSAPQIIAGPAVIQFNGNSYYTENDIALNDNPETFKVVSSIAGTIDERLIANAIEINFKPVGALDVVAKYLPYAVTQIGSLLINQASPKAVTIWGADGIKTVWANGFISKLPAFTLAATKTAIEPMAIMCFGDPTKTLVDAAAWNTITSAALADTTFDETKIVTPQYLATWGAITGFVAVESEDGFTFEVAMGLAMKKVANWGNVNAMLTDLTVSARFKPVGPTEANLWAARNLQGSGAVKPGMSLSTSNDLVISASPYTFTMPKAGIMRNTTQYGLTPLRHGELAFVNRKTWTGGSINALFTVAFS